MSSKFHQKRGVRQRNTSHNLLNAVLEYVLFSKNYNCKNENNKR